MVLYVRHNKSENNVHASLLARKKEDIMTTKTTKLQNQYAMDLLVAANKAVQKAVRINGKDRVRTLRAEALDNLGAEIVATFKGVELSDSFKQYANVLLVADCLKESEKRNCKRLWQNYNGL